MVPMVVVAQSILEQAAFTGEMFFVEGNTVIKTTILSMTGETKIMMTYSSWNKACKNKNKNQSLSLVASMNKTQCGDHRSHSLAPYLHFSMRLGVIFSHIFYLIN